MFPIRIATSRPNLYQGLQLSLRAAIAAALSLAAAQALQLQHPLYAMIAAVIVSDLSPGQTRKLAGRRVVATIIGAGCGILACLYLRDDALSIGASIFAAMLICNVLRAPESAKVAGYVCGIIVIAYSADPFQYAAYRLIETGIGIAFAWLVSLVPKLFDVRESPPPAL